MAVEDKHPDYERHEAKWAYISAVIEGKDCVMEQKLMPVPSGLNIHNARDLEIYQNYMKRGSYLNATHTSLEAMVGMVMNKPPVIEMDDGLQYLIESCDYEDQNIAQFVTGALFELLAYNRVGIMVDYPAIEGPMTRAQQRESGARPYLVTYNALDIFNWKYGRVNGSKRQLSQVRIFETRDKPGEDEFDDASEEIIRVLELVPAATGAHYQQRVFMKVKKGDRYEWVQDGDPIVPRMNGKMLDYIPFRFVSTKHQTGKLDRPRLYDLASKDVDLFSVDCDEKHALHRVASPTPYGTGVTQEDIDSGNLVRLGPENMLLTTSDTAKFGMVEFTGAGLEAIRNAKRDLKEDMASLGARMIIPEKKAAEAVETAAMQRANEHSILELSADNLGSAMMWLVGVMVKWETGDLPDTFSFKLSNDFIPLEISPQRMMALLNLVRSGRMSYATFYRNLQRGEVVAQERTVEEELEAIEDDRELFGDDLGIAEDVSPDSASLGQSGRGLTV